MESKDMENRTFKEMFYDTDLIVIIDAKGKVMYYEDYNDSINMLKTENAIGRSIYELYPYFSREDFTVFRAMDQKKPILNECQLFQVNGEDKSTMNSAFPLMNDSGVVGGMVISIELPRNPLKKKKDKSTAKYSFSDILTRNKEFKESLELLMKIAQNDSNVLIFGETGTGKELIAHAVHSASRRKSKPLIIQNCAAIPSSIMESILFGTKKGSYTGAIDQEGLFEAANGGTIFLDEINSMPLDLQSKVLRTIEDHSLRRVGETAEREVDVRVIASTNEDLAAKVEKKEFRIDLYYRLNVVSYTIPPLRERTDDIPYLCEHYIKHFNALLNKRVERVSDEVLRLFAGYKWKGNVRELKNVIEYALNVKDAGHITKKDLPLYLQTELTADAAACGSFNTSAFGSQNTTTADSLNARASGTTGASTPGAALAAQVQQVEEQAIRRAYEECGHNVMKTAKLLEIPRQTLYSKLKKYGLI